MQLSGFLFLLIIIILIICDILGHGTISDLNSEAKFQKINENPKKFTISFILLVFEHVTIIFLVVMLFIAFSQFNIMLAVIWTIFRVGEGLIQIYNKKDYWGLLKIASQYSGTSGAERNALIDLGRSIIKTKILFSYLHKSYSPLVRLHTQTCLLLMELYRILLDGLGLLQVLSIASVTGYNL